MLGVPSRRCPSVGAQAYQRTRRKEARKDMSAGSARVVDAGGRGWRFRIRSVAQAPQRGSSIQTARDRGAHEGAGRQRRSHPWQLGTRGRRLVERCCGRLLGIDVHRLHDRVCCAPGQQRSANDSTQARAARSLLTDCSQTTISNRLGWPGWRSEDSTRNTVPRSLPRGILRITLVPQRSGGVASCSCDADSQQPACLINQCSCTKGMCRMGQKASAMTAAVG
jgi:hypothetical protein